MFCSSATSAAQEDVLTSLPSLGQPKVRLPRPGPSQAGIRWFLANKPGDPGLTAPPTLTQFDRPTRCGEELLRVLIGSGNTSTAVQKFAVQPSLCIFRYYARWRHRRAFEAHNKRVDSDSESHPGRLTCLFVCFTVWPTSAGTWADCAITHCLSMLIWGACPVMPTCCFLCQY
jgi:hypothetical protein